MGKVRRTRKGFVTKATGSGDFGNIHVSVIGKKAPFRGCSYTVLVSSSKEKVSMMKGSFDDVVFSMKKKEAKEGIRLVREAAEILPDPKRTLTADFSDAELLCIALLKEAPLNLDDIADAIRMDKETAYMIIGGLQTAGIVCNCRRRGEPPNGYALTKKGRRKAELLQDEREFNLEQKKKS